MTVGSTLTEFASFETKSWSDPQTTTTSAAIPADNLAVVAIGQTGTTTPPADPTNPTGVTIDGNAMTKVAGWGMDGTEHAKVTLWVYRVGTEISSGATISVAGTGSEGAIMGAYFGFDSTKAVGVVGPGTQSATNTTTWFTSIGSNAPSAAMFIGAGAHANDDVGNSIDGITAGTQFPGWIQTGGGGGPTTEVVISGLYAYSSGGTESALTVSAGQNGPDSPAVKVGLYELGGGGSSPPIHLGRQYHSHLAR